MDELCYEGTLPNYSEGGGPGVCETLSSGTFLCCKTSSLLKPFSPIIVLEEVLELVSELARLVSLATCAANETFLKLRYSPLFIVREEVLEFGGSGLGYEFELELFANE